MSENNAKECEGLFEIDMEAVNRASKSHGFENNDKIHIFILTNTLPNPYLLVMFGILKRVLEEIKNKCGGFEEKIYINFLLVHKIGKNVNETEFFNPVNDHLKYYMPPDIRKENPTASQYISGIIDMRFNEFKTLANTILFNSEDRNGERLLTKDTSLRFSYGDIYDISDEIERDDDDDDDDVDNFMNTIKGNKEQFLKSDLLKDLLFRKVDEKDEIVRCLLRIFCHEIEVKRNNHEKKDAIFFIVDGWFKDMIEDYYISSIKGTSSPIFREVCEQLIYPTKDIEPTKVDLYLNQISPYLATGNELDIGYFASLLKELSCRLFKEPSESFYDMMITDYLTNNFHKGLKDRTSKYVDHITEYEGKEPTYQKNLNNIIAEGFLAVQRDILAQLDYIS